MPVAFAGPGAYVARTTTSLDLVNVANNNELPAGATTFATDSLAIGPTGTLYSADANGVVFSVSGPPIPVGPTGFAGVGDLDYGAGGLWGYSNVSGSLFFFDLGTATTTYSVAMPSLAAFTITGVAYRPSDGSVFLSGNTGLNLDTLFVVAPSSTTALPIGAMPNGDTFSYFADIDFDNAGTLYAMSWYHRNFYSVDPNTGATTLVSAGPHRDVTGMAIQAVPEPVTMGTLGLGLLALRRRRPRT